MALKDSYKLTTVERIYREVSQPVPPKPAPKILDPPPPINLEQSDVVEIVKGKRTASVEELSWILDRAKYFNLNMKQRNDIGLRISIVLASRGRPLASLNAELYAELDLAETPMGLLHHRSWFDRELRDGAKAIAACRINHTAHARCECWRPWRERLWLVQDKYGASSPEAWVAARLWEAFEEFEQASKPELNDEL